MTRLGMVMSYDILRENSGGVVAQAEHSIVVLDGGCKIIT
jgi:methionine aminopeptidase